MQLLGFLFTQQLRQRLLGRLIHTLEAVAVDHAFTWLSLNAIQCQSVGNLLQP